MHINLASSNEVDETFNRLFYGENGKSPKRDETPNRLKQLLQGCKRGTKIKINREEPFALYLGEKAIFIAEPNLLNATFSSRRARVILSRRFGDLLEYLYGRGYNVKYNRGTINPPSGFGWSFFAGV